MLYVEDVFISAKCRAELKHDKHTQRDPRCLNVLLQYNVFLKGTILV